MAVYGPVQSSNVFVDTYTASVFPINSDTVLLTSLLEESRHDTIGSHDQSIFLRPVTPSDSYVVKVKVQPEGSAVVRVMEGVCCVNGVKCDPGDNRQQLISGSFVELGSSYRLQYQTTPTNKPHPPRVLPRLPVQAPPTSHDETESDEEDASSLSDVPTASEVGGAKRLTSGSWSVSSVECGGMDGELRTRLKRIAKEVTAREHGYNDQRPPPPYEQVANSINYQLLHHTHSRVTKQLIDSLYHTLKEMELKDANLSNIYSTFLTSYSAARGQSATPTCMMPADLPVVTFVLEMLVHICCMPDMTPLATTVCPLWMDILSILIASCPNREVLVEVGGVSRILACMHLSVMCEEAEFHERGWVILGSVVDSPTPPGRKPVILDASLSLVLSLVAKQLQSHPSHVPLVSALLHTLARIATVAKEAATCDLIEVEGVFPTYTPLQGTQVLSLLRESDVLAHMMKVPPPLRERSSFHDNYCVLVKALHPIKLRKRVLIETTPPVVKATNPPPKPARKRKMRRSTIGTSPDEIKDSATPPAGHVTTEPSISRSGRRLNTYSVTVSKLIGSSDHVTHPLLLSTKAEDRHVTSKEDHVSSKEDHVSSGVSHVASKESDMPSQVDEKCVTSVESHVMPEAAHVTEMAAPVDQDEQQLAHDHVTEPVSHVTTVEGHMTPPISPNQQVDAEQCSPVTMVTSPDDQSDLFTFPQSDTLSRDVQSLLDSLRAPLPSVALEGRGRRNSHYFRHSVKRRSRKDVGVVKEVGVAKEPELIEEETGGQSPGRMQWGAAPPFLPSAEGVSLFEVSGEVLSASHTLLEEVLSGHNDITTTLAERAELLEGVLRLWREEKGLQAITNTLQGCFNEDYSDLPLFMDALNCFIQHKTPWTLAVCCVLLSALKEVISSQRDKSCVLTVVRVLLSVVERFSELILACKGRSRSKRLSSSIDRQQQVLCYQQLHAIRVAIGNRLDLNFDPKEVSSKLRKVHSALKPFKSEMSDS